MRRWRRWCGLFLAGGVLAGSGGHAATPLLLGQGLLPQSETYHVAALQEAPQKDRFLIQQDGAAIIASKQNPSTAANADVAGRYSILRDGGKDTGCMLTLESHVRATGGEKASLAPGCRDQGIVIFDPVGWQIVNGRLVLTARKGHKTHLDAQPDGTWKKDPQEGKSLSLKKL
ncbi:MAG TPA: AprI/Inh family metalloprotease inhibitor [Methylocella sp.]|nr:AprI/Inh family metalloprotease inhibitor [Methylocella sp.]